MKSQKKQFPIFRHNPELIYIDNAATTQKPAAVINRITEFYEKENSNIGRGIYDLANKATHSYEDTRKTLADYINCKPECIAFTSGATESVNIIAQSVIHKLLEKGDNIVVSVMEHHSNFLPWKKLCEEKGCELRTVGLNNNYEIDYSELNQLTDSRTRLVAVTHISNTLGSINDLSRISEITSNKKIPLLVDAAQSVVYHMISTKNLPIDFMVFSGHKMFGPFGTGIMYIKEKYFEEIEPIKYGGGMVLDIQKMNIQLKDYPYSFEAGTPGIAGVIGLGAALNFINSFDQKEIKNNLIELKGAFLEELASLQGISFLGKPDRHSTGIISFNLKNIHPHDIASFLNNDNICVRAGRHCTQPLFDYLGEKSSVRVSLSLYNSREESVKLRESLKRIIKIWG